MSPSTRTDKCASKGLVLSAMSGGVDSTVATALLIDEGFDVIGITMELFDERIAADREDGAKTAGLSSHLPTEIEDARDVCEQLGIEHLALDLKESFSRDVIDSFCQAYINGLTPNPCIECNRYLKIAKLQHQRKSMGADFVATGHYARRRYNKNTEKWELLRSQGISKDQSYVLYRLTQNDLAHTLFPLGGLQKSEVRELAASQHFANASKRESQDICFIPDGNHVRFIKEHASGRTSFEPGDIVDVDGKKLGTHNGLIHYTIGQRKGIGVASSRPLYVLQKDVANNRLVVAHKDDLMTTEALVADLNFISGEVEQGAHEVQVKCNYNQHPVAATLDLLSGDPIGTMHATIHFKEPQVQPAAGQSAVFYDGNRVIGGGVLIQ